MRRISVALVVALLSLCAVPRRARAGPCVDEKLPEARAAAFDARDPTAALAATVPYLEALNRLGQTETSCWGVMEADTPRLRELHCRASSPQRDSDTCVLLDRVAVDILRLAAARSIEAADRTVGEAAKGLYATGADRYLDTYRTYCEEPVKDGRPLHVTVQTCEEVAYNAARAFSAAHLGANAIGAYRLLVAEDARTKRGAPLAMRALYELGATYRSMALFEEAAESFEQLATLHPTAEKAPSALSDAALLRLGLSEEPQAATDIATFTRNWGITRRAEAAQLALTLATYHAEHGAKEKARAVLGGAMPMLDRGPLDLTVRAHALAANVAPSHAIARQEWAAVRAAWNDPEAAERALRRAWPGEDAAQGDRRVARALKAVGEARFAAAEEIRLAEVEPLKLVPFSGGTDRAALDTYGNTTLRAFLVKKRSAIEKAEAAYRQVLDIRPIPPPLSVVAASAAVGGMWGDFVDDLRRVPIPNALRKDPALERAYLEAITAATEPIRQSNARPAMKACVSFAARYAVLDSRADRCVAWLEKHSRTEHYRLDELVPSLRSAGILDVPPPASALARPLPAQDP